MTGSDKQMSDESLDALFAEMARDTPQPSDDLLSKIIADAEAAQPDLMPMPQPAQQRGIVQQILDALGGWPALGGLATATVAGVYIGFVQPDLMNFHSEATEDVEFTSTALWPDDGLFFDEG